MNLEGGRYVQNYKINEECYKFCKDNIKNKIVSIGISEDLFEALKELYNNVNFHEISDGATKRNNKLLFGDNDITFLNYSYKHFKSAELNPRFSRENIKLSFKISKIMIRDNIFKDCVDLKLMVRISKKSKALVRYKILINNVNYRHIERFVRIYEMSQHL